MYDNKADIFVKELFKKYNIPLDYKLKQPLICEPEIMKVLLSDPIVVSKLVSIVFKENDN